MKAILEFLTKNNRWAILLVIILLLIGGGLMKHKNNKIKDLEDKYLSEVKLKKALTDTITIYQDKEGDWVVEKLTLQASIDDLLSNKVTLTKDQQRLMEKVRKANKVNKVISAALIDAEATIDSLLHSGLVVVDTTKKTVEFIEPNDTSIYYDFKAFGILPYPVNTKPQLLIRKLTIPNEIFIKFQWENDKKEGYPITFSVTNSNDYVKVKGINSYAIPNLDRKVLTPTGWEKVTQWFNTNGKIIKYGVSGVVVGAGGTYLLMQ